MPSMSSRDVIKRLEAEGWRRRDQRGSHVVFVKDGVEGHVTVTHPKRDFPVGTLRSIFRQAGWAWPPR